MPNSYITESSLNTYPNHVEIFVTFQSYTPPSSSTNELAFSKGDLLVVIKKTAAVGFLASLPLHQLGTFRKISADHTTAMRQISPR